MMIQRDLHTALFGDTLVTPAFVIALSPIEQTLGLFGRLRAELNLRVLYSIKALPLADLIRNITPLVDGFSASSLFEARLIREVCRGQGEVHLTTPGLVSSEIRELAALCTHLSCNSLGQFERMCPLLDAGASLGLRVNPQLSLVGDERYDPCRIHTKLGVGIDAVAAYMKNPERCLDRLDGIHLHTNHGARRLLPLLQTVAHLEEHLGGLFEHCQWINLGGGYLYTHPEEIEQLARLVLHLRARYELAVYIEPGKGIVDHTGFLVASVIDLFEADGKTVAVLDTGINHLPEVFEYQRQPQVVGSDAHGCHRYLLAGNSCLSGDIFGDYGFCERLQLGSRLIFTGVGAYSLVKAHRFNGINLPAVYTLDAAGKLTERKRYGYEDFRRQWI